MKVLKKTLIKKALYAFMSRETHQKEYYAYQQKYLAKSDEKARRKVDTDTKFNTKSRTFDLKRFDYLTQLKELTGDQMSVQASFAFSSLAKKRMALYQEIAAKMAEKKQLMDNLNAQEAENTRALFNQKKDWDEKRRQLEFRKSVTNMDFPNILALDIKDTNTPEQRSPLWTFPRALTESPGGLISSSMKRKKEVCLRAD